MLLSVGGTVLGHFRDSIGRCIVVVEGPPLFRGMSMPRLRAVAMRISCSSSRSPGCMSGVGESRMDLINSSSPESVRGHRCGWLDVD